MNFLPRLTVALTFSLAAGVASALDGQPYSAQEKAFNGFKAEQRLALTILVVNYDEERALRQKLGVRTPSTVIVCRGSQEAARVAGETEPARLRAALQSAL